MATSFGLQITRVGRASAAARPQYASAVLLSHCAGMCKETWNPVIAALDERWAKANARLDVISFDLSGHGESLHRQRNGTEWGFWAKADVMEAYQRYREQEPQASIVGVGHSMGAAAVALAQLSVPGMFRSMVLFEPIIQPLPFKVPMSLLQKSALHTQTKRRRPFYPSIEDARSSLEGKPLFRSWHPEAFNAYIAHGFRPATPEEQRSHDLPEAAVALRCNPTFEADLYCGWNAGWKELKQRRPQEKAIVVAGAKTKTFASFSLTFNAKKVFKKIATRFPQGQFHVLPGTGHHMVMEDPIACASYIEEGLKLE